MADHPVRSPNSRDTKYAAVLIRLEPSHETLNTSMSENKPSVSFGASQPSQPLQSPPHDRLPRERIAGGPHGPEVARPIPARRPPLSQ